MSVQARPSLAADHALGKSRPSFGAGPGALKSHLAAWLETCADYYQAAALYDDLSRLSDAELARRGLSRATLAWDLCRSCDQTSGTK